MDPDKISETTPDSDEDARLMRRIREGEAIAFEELMTRHQTRVHSLLVHFVGDRDLAEDLTQEVFLKIYKARETYQPTAKFTTWLYRIVHNLALNALRSKRRKPEVLFSKRSTEGGVGESSLAIENNILAKSGFLPTRSFDKKEIQEMIHLAIDSLGERQKEALLLNRFEGMSYDQIADVMGLTPQAVKSLLCRARLNLREILLPYMEEGRRPE